VLVVSGFKRNKRSSLYIKEEGGILAISTT
jgi:hypothetical protein